MGLSYTCHSKSLALLRFLDIVEVLTRWSESYGAGRRTPAAKNLLETFLRSRVPEVLPASQAAVVDTAATKKKYKLGLEPETCEWS